MHIAASCLTFRTYFEEDELYLLNMKTLINCWGDVRIYDVQAMGFGQGNYSRVVLLSYV
mgnify:CR=1 FL=1